jgi:hypothetical protein
VSARALAVLFAVVAVIGLLGYGLLNKSAKALEPGDTVPSTALPKLDGQGAGSVADYRGRWRWSTSGRPGAYSAARSRRP